MRRLLTVLTVVALLGSGATAAPVSHEAALAALTPPQGRLWFGGYVGGQSGEEDDITRHDVTDYQKLLGQRLAWVYFSNNWFRDRAFPTEFAREIRALGAVPYVRLMLRSDTEESRREPLFTTAAIARGDFDADLAAWARAAADFGTPILAEYGTEVNGEWFSWNGYRNGKARGVRDFVAAYRRIIDIARANGATNIVWVFHINRQDAPAASWNRFENYYPGDDYIDWLGVSVYSTLGPREDEPEPFDSANESLQRLARMAPDKPIIIAEMGTDVRNPREPAAPWAEAALAQLLGGRWPQVIGFSWWNETWPNGERAADASDLRIASDPALLAVFRRVLADPGIAP